MTFRDDPGFDLTILHGFWPTIFSHRERHRVGRLEHRGEYFEVVAPALTLKYGQVSLHTLPAPRRAQSRALHGERASAAAVAAYVEDLRGSWRLEAEDRFLHPNQRSRGHVFSCIRPYSAGFTIDSLYSACLRLHAAL